jgi:hypothetical protein
MQSATEIKNGVSKRGYEEGHSWDAHIIAGLYFR